MTAREQVDLFLETYRRLESASNAFLPRDTRAGAIARLLRHPKFAPYREELDTCREVRNLLTHEVRVEGDPPVVPSRGMQDFLEKMIRLLENPPVVRDRMTPRERLLTVTGDQPLLPVMKEMQDRGLSRIPLVRADDTVGGVLSTETVFLATLAGVKIDEETRVSDLRPYLSLDAATVTSYRFVPPTLPLDDAEALFERMGNRRSKLRALLVTENGSPKSPLLGILSPYDVMNSYEGKKNKK